MDDSDQYSDDKPSKTRLKLQMHALQRIGAQLTSFSEAKLERLPLAEKLRAAIREYRRLPNSHGARRRQLQYIGRLMRDYDLEEIERQIADVLQPGEPLARERLIASLRDQVLQGGEDAINEVLDSHSQLDRQFLRQSRLEYQRALSAEADDRITQLEQRLTAYLRQNLAP